MPSFVSPEYSQYKCKKHTAFNPKMRLFFLLPETLTFWIPCVTVFRDAKLSSDGADE